MNRRAALRWAGTGVAAGLAGCLGAFTGGDGTKTVTPPGPTRATKSLVPEPPKEWTKTGGGHLSTRAIDMEEGYRAEYESTANNAYVAEVVRWHSKSGARKKAKERYGDWNAWVLSGKYSFAADGPDEQLCRKLLAGSPVLTRAYVDRKDD